MAAGALVGASLLTTLIVAIHPEVSSSGTVLLREVERDLQRWNFVHGLVLLDALAWLGAGRLTGGLLLRARRGQAVAGISLVAIGSLALGAIGGSEIVLGKIAAGTGGAASAELAAQFDNAGAVVYLVPAVAMLTVGLAVLMLGLAATRFIPAAAAVAFVVGTAISNPPIPRTVNLIGQLIQLGAAVVIARDLTVRGEEVGASGILVGQPTQTPERSGVDQRGIEPA
ncbi:MAG: hypothetical protein ABR505_03020 [Actinomycetota bacterium]